MYVFRDIHYMDIVFYISLYFLLAILISIILIYLFPESEYIKTAPIGMSYTQFVFDRIYTKLSEMWRNVQQVISDLHHKIVERIYPEVATNVVYR